MTTVGTVEKLAISRQADSSCSIGSFKVLWQGGDSLHVFKMADSIVNQDFNSRIKLTDQIGDFVMIVENDMAGTSSSGTLVGVQRSDLSIFSNIISRR